MTERLDGARMLIYSHDTFGLGHLRRCQTIAHALVERYKGLSIIILSGSPIIGSFDFRARVDFVRVPGVIKLYNGEYTSLALHIDIQRTLAIRASIMRHTAEVFRPDLFLVDKEPLGLRGELTETLNMLKGMGTKLVLGLRDVMDEPGLLRREWEARQLLPSLTNLYDEIWVYGMEEVWNPLAEMNVPPAVTEKMLYTGYLKRTLPLKLKRTPAVEVEEPYVLVTAGGGGDGYDLFDWVLRAYEADNGLPYAPLFVLGPFMTAEEQEELHQRIERLPGAQAITFDAHVEFLMAEAAGVISMCGYNTFCEILSFDKPAVIVPRCKPREEQLVRARQAQNLGLVRMLSPESSQDTALMQEAIRGLPAQHPPSRALLPGMLDGLENVARLARPHLLGADSRERPAAAASVV
ncbi:MAG: glycosyltransferase family protein [Methyloligellaceae bacterium]